KPLTQKQLGGLLRPFGVISETVSVPGFNDAKGYKRIRFEEAWEAYCPGQNLLSTNSEFSKRRSVGMPMESAQVSDFQSVAEASGDGLKNNKLPNSHAGFDASTFRKDENGREDDSATNGGGKVPSDAGLEELAAQRESTTDYPELPACLRRTPPPL